MKPIPGHKSYFANDRGEIISFRRKEPRILKGYVNQDGYLTVTVTADDGIKRKTLVHRLVISAYKGSSPSENGVVRHLNGNQLDNAPKNLEWGTAFDNYMDAVHHGTRANGSGIGGHITPPDTVRAIREDKAEGVSYKELGRRHGVSATQAYRVRNYKRWNNID